MAVRRIKKVTFKLYKPNIPTHVPPKKPKPFKPVKPLKAPPLRPSTPARPTLAAALPTLYGSQGKKVPKKTMKAAKTLDKRAARKRGK